MYSLPSDIFYWVLFSFYRTPEDRTKLSLNLPSWKPIYLKLIALFLSSFWWTTFIFLSLRCNIVSSGGENIQFLLSLHAGGWMVEKETGIRNEVAILNSPGQGRELTKWAREGGRGEGWRLDFCARPLVPGSARLKNPRWRSITERNGFSAMKPPVTACKQANFFFLNWVYVCFSPLFSGVFLNVIRYSKRIEILLYSVSFCPLR